MERYQYSTNHHRFSFGLPHQHLSAIDPKSGKRYKATACLSKEARSAFQGATCLMPISVGQLSHDVESPQYGPKFEATITLINKCNFGKCIILVDDTIQFDTYKLLYPEKMDDELYRFVREVGDDWIQHHEPYCQQLTVPFEIKRWNEVEADPDFERAVEHVRERYSTDTDYKAAFDTNINQFLSRLKKRRVVFDPIVGFQQCLRYLIKENAGMGFVWPKWGAHFEIYPSGRNPSMSATFDVFVKPHYPGRLISVPLRFTKSHVNPSNSNVSDTTTISTVEENRAPTFF